jgi:hypothetical protein
LPGRPDPVATLRRVGRVVKWVGTSGVVSGPPQVVNGTCDENEFRSPDAGRIDVVVIARRIRRRVVVTVSVGCGILVRVNVPPEVPIRIVAVVKIVVVSHRPPDGDGGSRRLTDAVVELETQFTGTHRIVQRPTRERFETFELGAKLIESPGIDGAPQRVRLRDLHRLTR